MFCLAEGLFFFVCFLVASSGTWIDFPNHKGEYLNFISNIESQTCVTLAIYSLCQEKGMVSNMSI